MTSWISLLLGNFSLPATPVKVHHCSMFLTFVDNVRDGNRRFDTASEAWLLRNTGQKRGLKHPDHMATTEQGFGVLHPSWDVPAALRHCEVPGFYFYEAESFVITELYF